MNYGFKKAEHLCGKKNIETLFYKGEAFLLYPYRVVFLKLEKSDEKKSVRVMISVPKKRFKHAVDRNLLKRRTREAYRLKKHPLINFAEANNFGIHISIQYIANETITTNRLIEKMDKIVELLIEKNESVN